LARAAALLAWTITSTMTQAAMTTTSCEKFTAGPLRSPL
jgi:hypothetical protein